MNLSLNRLSLQSEALKHAGTVWPESWAPEVSLFHPASLLCWSRRYVPPFNACLCWLLAIL